MRDSCPQVFLDPGAQSRRAAYERAKSRGARQIVKNRKALVALGRRSEIALFVEHRDGIDAGRQFVAECLSGEPLVEMAAHASIAGPRLAIEPGLDVISTALLEQRCERRQVHAFVLEAELQMTCQRIVKVVLSRIAH